MLAAAYLAGLFDGEGWVVSNKSRMKNRNYPTFQITAGIAMTYGPIIRTIHAQYDGWFKADDSFRRKNPANRTVYRWYVSSVMAARFLSDICPHTVVKREQIEIALELQQHIWDHKSDMSRWNHEDDKKKVLYAHRQALADRLRALKKETFDTPVESDPSVAD